MDWDDEFGNGYDDIDYASQQDESIPDKSAERGFDPMDIANPVSAYFFLSDDAQDEIRGCGSKKMRCQSCGHRFKGESYDLCPKCDSVFTEEAFSFIEDEEASHNPNMKCLDCGHAFVGGNHESCPVCHSAITEETVEEINDGDW